MQAFAPNQLHYSAAKAIGRVFGIEATSTVLGHSDLKTSEIYAERNLEQAIKVAQQLD
jgi:hypothetical protein